jgi:hypothetical protein
MQQHTRHFWTHFVKVVQRPFVGKFSLLNFDPSLAFAGFMVGTWNQKTHSQSTE